MTQSSGQQAPIEVEATPIEEELVLQGSVERQLAALEASAAEFAAQYRPHDIADRQDDVASKKARGAIRSQAKTIKAAGREITQRADLWSAGVRDAANGIAQRLEDLADEYDARVKTYEQGVVDARMERMRLHYEEYAPALALPAEGADAALVPFGILWRTFAHREKWDLYGTSDVKAMDGLEDVVERIAQGERGIDSLVAEHDREAVKALYFSTLDMDRAMARASELAEARARLQAMEAERAAWAAQSETAPEAGPEPAQGAVPYEPPRTLDVEPPAPAQACPQSPRPIAPRTVMSRQEYEAEYEQVTGRPAPQPAPRPQPLPDPSRAASWIFYCRCTPQQAGLLEDYARQIGVHRLMARDGGTVKYKLVPAKEA